MREAVIVEALRTPIGRGKTRGRGSVRDSIPRTSAGAGAARGDREGRRQAGGRGAADRRLRDAGRRAGGQPVPQRVAVDGDQLRAGRDDDRHAVRFGAAGEPPDLGAGRTPAPGRHRHRLRGGGDEPRGPGRERVQRPGLLSSRRTGRGMAARRTSSVRPSASRRTAALTRADVDAFALESQRRAAAAQAAGSLRPRGDSRWRPRCFGEDGKPTGATKRLVTRDQGVRATTAGGAGGSEAGQAEGGIHTAGNSSQVSDGACRGAVDESRGGRAPRPEAARAHHLRRGGGRGPLLPPRRPDRRDATRCCARPA
jgi:hypothetical protein